MPYTVFDPGTATAVASTVGAPLTSVGSTLADIRSEIEEELLERTDLTPTKLNRWVNYAYRNLCGMITLKELKASITWSLVASQPLYSLPMGVAAVKSVAVIDTTNYLQGGRQLDSIDEIVYRRLEDLTDEPEMFFRFGRLLVFWPTPETARTVTAEVRVRPQDLVNDTDSPILPVEFHEVLMLMAKHRALRATGQPVLAKDAMNDALATLRPLIDTDSEERAGQQAHLVPAKKSSDLYRSRR